MKQVDCCSWTDCCRLPAYDVRVGRNDEGYSKACEVHLLVFVRRYLAEHNNVVVSESEAWC